MYCVHCGSEIPDDARFCIECGAPAEEEVVGEESGAAMWTASESSRRGKKPLFILLILLAVLLAAAVTFFVVRAIAPGEKDNSSTTTTTTAAPSAKKTDPKDLQVIYSDWDWDSSRTTGGKPEVDNIMLVKNNSENAVTGLKFSVKSSKGNKVNNAGDPEKPFVAEGYIPAGEEGVMVARMVVDKEKIRPDQDSYVVTEVLSNPAIPEDYRVPMGTITDNHGEDNNYYDIRVDNPNPVDAAQSSLVVAVKYSDDDPDPVSDADATGKLTSDIKAGESGFEQKDAFYDPNFYGNAELYKYRIYILDTDYYQNAGK